MGLALAWPRVGVHPGFTRVVFDLPTPQARYTLKEGNPIEILFPGLQMPPREEVVNSKEVASVQVLRGGEGTRVLIRTPGPVELRLERYQDPERLVLDLLAPDKRAQDPPSPSPRAQPPSLPKPVVLLDPGHGGVDPGMVGYVVEKAVTLDVALRLKRLLEAQRIQVLLTRDRDTHLSPDKREDLARRAAMADSSRVNLFLSIHVNASPTRTARGVEVYYFGRAPSPEVLAQVVRENGGGEIGRRLTEEARSAAERILLDILAQSNQRHSRELAETIGRKLSQATGSPYRGSFPGDFFVLRYARVPAVLVEVGFGDHPVEGRNLADPAYRERVARGLLQGVLTFLARGAYLPTAPRP